MQLLKTAQNCLSMLDSFAQLHATWTPSSSITYRHHLSLASIQRNARNILYDAPAKAMQENYASKYAMNAINAVSTRKVRNKRNGRKRRNGQNANSLYTVSGKSNPQTM